VVSSEQYGAVYDNEPSESAGCYEGGQVFGGEGELEFFDAVNDCAGPFGEGVVEVAFGGLLALIFFGV
jgi:hypothetical protein